MKLDNYEVTLDWEADQNAGPTGFMHWLLVASLTGDDGNEYNVLVDPFFAKLENVLVLMMRVSSERGKIYELPYSIYRVAEFFEPPIIRRFYQKEDLKVKKSEHEVTVDVGDFHLVCKDDKTWHWNIEDKEHDIKIDLVHHGIGYPTWYGTHEKPGYCTTHSIDMGYFWSGPMEGTLTIKGKKVKVKGAGNRERVVTLDQCAAEVAGWEDYAWFYFDELLGGNYDMRYGNKDMSFYLIDDKIYCDVVKFENVHSQWAYMKQIGVFVPMHYKIIAEADAGILEIDADCVGGLQLAGSGKVPDTPISHMDWDNVQGTFTYKDGRKKKLTNGRGSVSIRQWKPYPNIMPLLFNDASAEESGMQTFHTMRGGTLE